MMVKENIVIMVIFQESKQRCITNNFISTLWKNDHLEFLEVDSLVNAGGEQSRCLECSIEFRARLWIFGMQVDRLWH